MLAVPAVAGGLVAAGSGIAGAGVARAATQVAFTSRRSKLTLPDPLPATPLGLAFSAWLDLYDKTDTKIGDGSLSSMIVDVIVGLPLKIVVHSKVVFRITGGGFGVGEIHVSNMHIRVVPEPGVKHVLAIVGGTGAYSTAQGDGQMEYVTATDTSVVLNLA
ncbi:hypothetical protein F0L68_07210 [Solihabitans fulvus]|uniref:Uncharacterized protein n=1 Tax=Solihabitans fulvus TaxID=1892852 RepID=A0A5B2XM46_9PSEU|nr:hypothetical protein [Solihabitans fulvus]KAA2264857.1 hypothetical protein F0L68_07210 [Solihabitans fulvus]